MIENSLVTRSWTGKRNIGRVEKTFYNDETNPTDLIDPHI